MDNAAQNPVPPQVVKLEEKIKSVKIPEDLHEKVIAMVERLKLISREASFFSELDATSRYIDWVTALPWYTESKDTLDLTHAREVFDTHHYGLTDVKTKVLEYLSIMIMQTQRGNNVTDHINHAPIISLVGLVGVGKTTIAYSIAEALGRKVERIPFGGMGKASQLRGQSRYVPDAEPGQVIKALRRAGTNNPVILLDEIDRVSEEARADIMGVLIELLDPEQNMHFTDMYIDYPFDLSNVLFIATSNNTKNISTAVLDRLEIIQMPSYSDDEKIQIAKSYLLPEILKESAMTQKDLVVDDDVWVDIVRPLGYDSGIRSLKRVIQQMVRRAALFMLQGKIHPDQSFRITKQNLKYFVPQW